MQLLFRLPIAIGVIALSTGLVSDWGELKGVAASAGMQPSSQVQPTGLQIAQRRRPRPRPAPAPATNLSTIEQSIFNQINQYRASMGLAPLIQDATTTQQARSHSQAMATGQRSFGHDGFQERVQVISTVIPVKGAAENVAYNVGYSDPATVVVNGWLNSPGHKANIMGNYNRTGVGVAVTSNGTYYFTQVFVLSN
jgi:uncharacterized protein YkwD